MTIVGWFMLSCYAFACCFCYLFVRDLDGQDHYHIVHLIVSRLFLTVPHWWWLHSLWLYVFDLSTLFQWCQIGEDEYDHALFCFTLLPSLSPTLNFSFTFVAWMFGMDIFNFCPLWCGHGWSFGLSSSKRGKLLTPSLCKVLMITNTNIVVHMLCLSCVVEIGFEKY